MENQSFFSDRNYDGDITISDIWISIQDLLIPAGNFIQSIANYFANSFIGKFFELDAINLERDTLALVGLCGIVGIVIIVFIFIATEIEDYIHRRHLRNLRKDNDVD